ncbi:MAG: TAXI family TRAP transporter solute-binding subunit [Hyphomicrobiales bacterium]|nr:TAXI family TRAP transporter solute-binding subunit [Hyphomicrobiales bacterium]MCP5370988.1 TAXI family TRAP transporter solute-binding subunit [Hyphomicrobiales bacterium]
MSTRIPLKVFAVAATLFAAASGLPSANAKTLISIGSCPVGCTAYTWAAGIADVINKNVQEVQATAEETKGYVANVKLMSKGEMEAGMANSLSAYSAFKAEGPFKGAKPGAVLSWLSIAPMAVHIITLKDGSVKSVGDLKGKRVGMGQPGGTSMLDAEALVEGLGLKPGQDFKDFRVRLGNMVDMLSDGNLDAAIWNGSFPLPPVIKLSAQHEVSLVPIPDDVYARVHAKFPPYFQMQIPAKTYNGIDTPTSTYGLGNVLVISASVPEDAVYEMTKAIMTNLGKLKDVHPAFGRVKKETVLNGFAAPLHPGALRYYREINVPGIEDFVKRTAGK